MNLRIKKLSEKAVLPEQMTSGAAAFDLTASSKEYDEKNDVIVFGTSIAVEIPKGHVGLLFPRSSIYKTGLSLCNSAGVIDSDYRGEIKFMFYPQTRPKKNYDVGDRIGQLMIVQLPSVNLQVVEELSNTARGTGGFGSTNK